MPRQSASLPPGLPDCLKKRRLSNEKALGVDQCRDYGEKFLALGWLEDALEFFRQGNHSEGLAKIKTLALESGDAYLLARLGIDDPELWRQAGQRALDLGKLQFAQRAFQAAGQVERAQAIAHLIEGRPPAH